MPPGDAILMDADLNGCCWELASVGERSGKLYCAEWLKDSNCVLLAVSSSFRGLFHKGRALPLQSPPSFSPSRQSVNRRTVEQVLGSSQIPPHHLSPLYTHWPRWRQSSHFTEEAAKPPETVPDGKIRTRSLTEWPWLLLVGGQSRNVPSECVSGETSFAPNILLSLMSLSSFYFPLQTH